jgi:hypothetical protein
VETHVTPARHAVALRGGGSPAPAGQRRSDWFFCLVLAVVTGDFQQRLFFGPRGHGKTFLDFLRWNALSLGASERSEDGSTRWSRDCGTDSPPDICAFGDYRHRPSEKPIHLWLRLAGVPAHLICRGSRVGCNLHARPAFARLRLGRHACHYKRTALPISLVHAKLRHELNSEGVMRPVGQPEESFVSLVMLPSRANGAVPRYQLRKLSRVTID